MLDTPSRALQLYKGVINSELVAESGGEFTELLIVAVIVVEKEHLVRRIRVRLFEGCERGLRSLFLLSSRNVSRTAVELHNNAPKYKYKYAT